MLTSLRGHAQAVPVATFHAYPKARGHRTALVSATFSLGVIEH